MLCTFMADIPVITLFDYKRDKHDQHTYNIAHLDKAKNQTKAN